jgi:hypothetical protein
MLQITQDEAVQLHLTSEIGAVVQVDINSRDFGRIATANAKNIITQKIREEEKNAVINYFSEMKNTAVTGIVGRRLGRNLSINLGRADGILPDKEQIPGEVKSARFDRLLKLETAISTEKNQALVGKTVRVLCDGISKTDAAVYCGRTERNKIVFFAGRPEDRGTFLHVRIDSAEGFALRGEVIR